MITDPIEQPGSPERRSAERGSALFIALILIVVLTFLGFGLLTRSLMVARITGSERWSTKAFYAADAGISAARARLRIMRTDAFVLPVSDLRGETGTSSAGQIQVTVSELVIASPAQAAPGTMMPGGQGSSQAFVSMFYRGTSTAQQALTRSERRITASMGVGPVPPAIPTS